MVSIMSKVFIECKKFLFVGQIVKHDGFWDLLLAICQLWYPLFRLLRLADMRGGIDKVKYYVCQVDPNGIWFAECDEEMECSHLPGR